MVHEAQNLQFRFEMFNTANHAEWSTPNANWISTSLKTPGAAFTSITFTANAIDRYSLR